MITAKQAFMQSLGIDEDTYNAKMENVYGEINKAIEEAAAAGGRSADLHLGNIVSSYFSADINNLPEWLYDNIYGKLSRCKYKVCDESCYDSGTLFCISW